MLESNVRVKVLKDCNKVHNLLTTTESCEGLCVDFCFNQTIAVPGLTVVNIEGNTGHIPHFSTVR